MEGILNYGELNGLGHISVQNLRFHFLNLFFFTETLDTAGRGSVSVAGTRRWGFLT